MNNKIKFCAFAGIVYLILFLPELIIQTIGELDQTDGIASTLLRTTYVVSTLSTFLFFYGFIIIGHKLNNNLLIVGSIIIILTTVFYDIYEWYNLGVYDIEKDIVGVSALLLYGFSGIVFGFGLFKIRDIFGTVASAAAILEIIVGFFFVTIVLFLLGLILSIPAIILEILLLLKAAESSELKGTSNE